MPSARGITCSLKIEGQNHSAEEYDIQCNGLDNFASAYVVAEEDKRFSLKVAVTAWVHSDLATFVYIDGVYQTRTIWKGISPSDFLREAVFSNRRKIDEATYQQFKMAWKFDKLAVVDEREADCEKGLRVLSNIGTIEVVVIRCKSAKTNQKPDGNLDPHPYAKSYWGSWFKDHVRVPEKPLQPQTKTVFEKDIKGRGISYRVTTVFEKDTKGRGISHRVTTGPRKEDQTRYASFDPLDSFENPYCILVMQYRSRGLLQNMGLIPTMPIPSPSPSLGITALPDITRDDLEQMKELSKEGMMRELLRYKKQESLRLGQKVKLESREANYEEGRKKKRARRDEKVVIDLTDD